MAHFLLNVVKGKEQTDYTEEKWVYKILLIPQQ